MAIRKVGRDAISGRFIPLERTRRFPGTTTVETMNVPTRRPRRRRATRSVRKSEFKAGKDLR